MGSRLLLPGPGGGGGGSGLTTAEVTAHPGGGIEDATPLTAQRNLVTVASAGDSCIMPAAVVDTEVWVSVTAGGGQLQLFAPGSDQFSDLSGDLTPGSTGVTQNGNSSTIWTCFANGVWVDVSSDFA